MQLGRKDRKKCGMADDIYIYMLPCPVLPPPPEGERFPVIALDSQHRRSASALFVRPIASAKS